MDGTPADGSRTYFFDAARFAYNLPDAKTTVDMIYLVQNHRGNAVLPPLLSFNQNVVEQNEKGFVLWVANRSLPNTEIDGYYMYKDMDRALRVTGSDDGYIHAFGARVAGDITDHWKYRAEGAHEFGRRNDQYLRAFGLNSQLTYLFKDKWNNQLRTFYEFLSGDDPNTRANEGFVLLWGRWARWSELYGLFAFPATGEGRVGDLTNLHRVGGGWSCNPTEKLELAADYHLLFAPENSMRHTGPGSSTPASFSEEGKFRGELLTLCATYTFTKHLKGHILNEFFFPGNYYSKGANDAGVYLRGELYFTW